MGGGLVGSDAGRGVRVRGKEDVDASVKTEAVARRPCTGLLRTAGGLEIAEAGACGLGRGPERGDRPGAEAGEDRGDDDMAVAVAVGAAAASEIDSWTKKSPLLSEIEDGLLLWLLLWPLSAIDRPSPLLSPT